MKTTSKRYPKIVVGTFALALVILIMSFIAYDKSATEANNTVLEITSVSIIDGNYKIDTNIAINNGIKEKLHGWKHILNDLIHHCELVDVKSINKPDLKLKDIE